MRLMKCFMLSLLLGCALMASAQPATDNDVVWYLDEVVNDVFVGHYDFEYYYVPSAADMAQQRDKGEVSYFLNSPGGLNVKKVRDMIDRLMSSYDDIKAVGDWHMTTGTYWKEFRHDRNKFRFSVKRKALDDGTYYVSVTESANYFKSLGKKNTQERSQTRSQSRSQSRSQTPEKPVKSKADSKSARHSRKAVTADDVPSPREDMTVVSEMDDELVDVMPVISERRNRQETREQREEQRMEERARQRRTQEKRREEAKAKREEAKAQREAEKQQKAEAKRQKEEEKRLKKEEERQRREQERLQRRKAQQEQQASNKKTASRKASKYHQDDVALWLSEKYDFTMTQNTGASCKMYSTAVKDVEMAKLAIKNALKGSNARMAVPWRVNADTQAVETGYTVDDHVLVFAIGKNDDGLITLEITEVSNDRFELFKQSLGTP